MSGNIVHLTDDSFVSEVLQSGIPVMVDFYADWCNPCKKIAPIIESLANEYAGKVKFCKMDVDANSERASEFGIRSIPTVKMFVGGKEVDSKTGFSGIDVYKQMITKQL